MRLGRKTATAPLLIGIVAFSLMAQADTTDPNAAETASQRNPVEWLFSDLKSLFEYGPVTKQAPAAPEPVLLTSPQLSEPTPIIAAPAVETSPDTESSTTINPFASILRDLARLFDGPDETPQTTVAESDAIPVIAPNEDLDADDTTNVEPAPVETAPEAVAEPVEHGDVVSWLVSDLVSLFSGSNTETLSVEVTADQSESAPVVQTAQPADEFAGLTFTPDISTTAPVMENAAWHINARGNLFDPDTPAISLDPSFPRISRTAPVETAEATLLPTDKKLDIAEQSEPLRARPRPTLADLNVGSLGRKHKAVTEDPADQGFFSKLFGTFGGDDENESTPATQPSETAESPVSAQSEVLTSTISDRIVPEESLDLGYTTPDTDMTRRSVKAISENAVADIDLFLGNKILIGNKMPADALESGNCIERSIHRSVFCLEPMNWPAKVAELFAQDTAYTLPGEGVVRYENGRLSRAYNVFSAADFADVVKYMQRRFGPPSEREIIWMHMLEAPELPNTTFRWKAVSADRRDIIVLEVRNYDDLRRSFADLQHGMVRLYRDGSRPIFKHLSTMDLMLLQRRRIANAPADPASEKSAN